MHHGSRSGASLGEMVVLTVFVGLDVTLGVAAYRNSVADSYDSMGDRLSTNPPPPLPGTLSIVVPGGGYTVTEGAGASITISVSRTGGSSGAVTVAYATSAGSAGADSDFTSTSGTLSWASGDTANKTFTVAIRNNGASESTEPFTVTISSPGGDASLGTPSSTTVTILDDD